MRGLRLLCLALICALLPVAAGAEAALDLMTVVRCEDWVSLRQGPDANTARLAKVPKGAVLIDEHLRWGAFVGVRYGKISGYIQRDYLKQQSRAARVGASGAILRTEPNNRSKPVKAFKAGTKLLLVEDEGRGWCYVCQNGTYGYLPAKRLRAVQRKQGKPKRVVKCASFITLREGPSTQSAELRRIPLGAEVLSYGSNGLGMDYIWYGGDYGFALSGYLKAVKAAKK